MEELKWLGVKFKKRERDKKRAKAYKKKKNAPCYVGSNIEKMWWGSEAMTPNLWRDK